MVRETYPHRPTIRPHRQASICQRRCPCNIPTRPGRHQPRYSGRVPQGRHTAIRRAPHSIPRRLLHDQSQSSICRMGHRGIHQTRNTPTSDWQWESPATTSSRFQAIGNHKAAPSAHKPYQSPRHLDPVQLWQKYCRPAIRIQIQTPSKSATASKFEPFRQSNQR